MTGEFPTDAEPGAPEQNGAQGTDYAEQFASLDQKLDHQQDDPPQLDSSQVPFALAGLDQEQPDGEDDGYYPEDFNGADPNEPGDVEYGYPDETEYADQGPPDRLDQVIGYLQEREDAENAREINAIAEEYPIVAQPEVRQAIAQRVTDLAERAGDERLRLDPEFVRLAAQAEIAQRAERAQISADKARFQGASLEVDATAAVDSERPYTDQMMDEVKGAGGAAFPT